MNIIDGFKICRKGLHQYPADKSSCPQCNKERQKRWYKNNKERLLSTSKERYKNNKEKLLAAQKKWYKNNKEKALAASKERYKNNKERELAARKEWRKNNKENICTSKKEWYSKNKHKVISNTAKRRALQKQAIPLWANMEKIRELYKKADALTASTGVMHHVDHICPLQSDYMCGLHVETNLQILTAEENIRKSNRTWPGQLDCQKGSVYDIFLKELTDLLND